MYRNPASQLGRIRFSSDRGSQCTSSFSWALVKLEGMRSSIRRTGVCWVTVYETKERATHDVIQYIEGFYNSRRRLSALDCRRPNEVHYSYQQPELAA